jgi:hypothetical protein
MRGRRAPAIVIPSAAAERMVTLLEVVGPYEARHGAASRGIYAAETGAVPVYVLMGPEGAAADAVARARAAAGSLLGAHPKGVLPLLAIEEHDRRVVWMHEAVDGLGLGHVVGNEGAALLSSRAVAELIADVAETMLLLEPDARRNRGPEPTDLLLDALGNVWTAGFAGPFATSPAMRAPRGDEGEPAVVYRLGVLMAHLVAGIAPQPATEKAAHSALVRRALIRAMARPGPVLSERYGDWMRGMLAWEPGERPPLSSIPEGLRQVAVGTGGTSLRDWAAVTVPGLIDRIEHPDRVTAPRAAPVGLHDDSTEMLMTEEVGGPPTDSGPPTATAPPVRRPLVFPDAPGGGGYADPTADAPRPVAGRPGSFRDDFEDDPTQEASALSSTAVRNVAPPPAIRTGSAGPAIPVRVGPPPEAIREPPSLPSGFLDDGPGSDEEPTAGVPWMRILVAIVWVSSIVVLTAAAILFIVYLLLPGRPPPVPVDEPSLSDALPAPSADSDDPSLRPPEPPAPPPVLPEVVPPSPVPLAPSFEVFPPPPPGTAPVSTPAAVVVTPLPPQPAPIVAPPVAVPPTTFEIVFTSPSDVALDVVCNAGSARGTGRVVMSDARRGPCTVAAIVAGRPVRTNVAIAGPTTLHCFEAGSSTCTP